MDICEAHDVAVKYWKFNELKSSRMQVPRALATGGVFTGAFGARGGDGGVPVGAGCLDGDFEGGVLGFSDVGFTEEGRKDDADGMLVVAVLGFGDGILLTLGNVDGDFDGGVLGFSDVGFTEEGRKDDADGMLVVAVLGFGDGILLTLGNVDGDFEGGVLGFTDVGFTEGDREDDADGILVVERDSVGDIVGTSGMHWE
jgi:hypothetical protein